MIKLLMTASANLYFSDGHAAGVYLDAENVPLTMFLISGAERSQVPFVWLVMNIMASEHTERSV